MAITIRSGSKTGTAQSSYANVREAVAQAQAARSPKLTTGGRGSSGVGTSKAQSPLSTPSTQSPPSSVRTETAQAATISKETPYYASGGWDRVKAVLNPFNWDKIYLTDPRSGLIKADVTIPVKTLTVASEIGGAAYLGGLAAGVGGATAAGSAGSAAVATSAAGSMLRTAAVAGGAGLVAGSLLSGGSKQTTAPQAQDQAQDQKTDTGQTSLYYDYSQRSSQIRNTQNYNIVDSPGASIYGSQTATPNLSSAFNPYQSVDPYLSGSQDQSQQQQAAGSQSWLIPALIVGAVLLLKK